MEKAGFRKKAWTIQSACSALAFGLSIRSMAPANLSREFRSSVFRSGSLRTAIPRLEGSTIQQRTKPFLGSIESGVTYNGKPSQPSQRKSLDGALVLASRSEVNRGEWKPFENAAFKIRPMGSVAYKLALVSVGLADVTFTLTPKNEWDVVAGAALVQSAGGFVSTLEKTPLVANRRDPLLSGLLASGPFLKDELLSVVGRQIELTVSSVVWPNGSRFNREGVKR